MLEDIFIEVGQDLILVIFAFDRRNQQCCAIPLQIFQHELLALLIQ